MQHTCSQQIEQNSVVFATSKCFQFRTSKYFHNFRQQIILCLNVMLAMQFQFANFSTDTLGRMNVLKLLRMKMKRKMASKNIYYTFAKHSNSATMSCHLGNSTWLNEFSNNLFFLWTLTVLMLMAMKRKTSRTKGAC